MWAWRGYRTRAPPPSPPHARASSFSRARGQPRNDRNGGPRQVPAAGRGIPDPVTCGAHGGASSFPRAPVDPALREHAARGTRWFEPGKDGVAPWESGCQRRRWRRARAVQAGEGGGCGTSVVDVDGYGASGSGRVSGGNFLKSETQVDIAVRSVRRAERPESSGGARRQRQGQSRVRESGKRD